MAGTSEAFNIPLPVRDGVIDAEPVAAARTLGQAVNLWPFVARAYEPLWRWRSLRLLTREKTVPFFPSEVISNNFFAYQINQFANVYPPQPDDVTMTPRRYPAPIRAE